MTIVTSTVRRGFTLIELLVVIAIIGILSSVVLASLNTARNRGADAAIRSNLNNARAQSELFYDVAQTYSNVCTAAGGVSQFVTGAGSAGSTNVSCGVNTTSNQWAMQALLRGSTNFYCVDSTGAATNTAASSVGNGQAANTDVTCGP